MTRAAVRSLAFALFVAVLLHAPRSAPAQAPMQRPGIRVRYTSIDTAGGVQGEAFLIISSHDVAVRPAQGTCSGMSELAFTGRLREGPIRAVTIRVVGRAPGDLVVRDAPCPLAHVETTLEDGTVLAGTGSVKLQSLSQTDRGGCARGELAENARHGNAPVSVTGTFFVRWGTP